MSEPSRPTVVIIGGGITGLSAAWELSGGDTPDPGAPEIIVLEATNALGGKVQATSINGRTVDLGPDQFLARRPEAVGLCRELGIADTLVGPSASGASVFARGKLRPLPDKLNLGVPTSWRALRRSKILSTRGLLRAGRDIIAPKRDLRGPLGDRAIGPLVEQKLGNEVVASLVDPLIGGIYAGRVAEMSTAAVFPPLLQAAGTSGSMMHALRLPASMPVPEGEDAPLPVLVSLPGGAASLVASLSTQLEARGVSLRTGVAVSQVLRGAPGVSTWSILTSDGPFLADGVMVTTPTPVAAAILDGLDAELVTLLEAFEYASVAVVTFSFNAEELPARTGTGFLVPSPTQRVGGDATFITTAATYLDDKWPHLHRDGETLIRLSAGKIDDTRAVSMDDATLVAVLLEELRELTGISATPTTSTIMRWREALPQYKVNHQLRVAGIEGAVSHLPGLEVAGAALHGIGIPACIGSGRRAASRLAVALGVRNQPLEA